MHLWAYHLICKYNVYLCIGKCLVLVYSETSAVYNSDRNFLADRLGEVTTPYEIYS